jgi:hypothetical protein
MRRRLALVAGMLAAGLLAGCNNDSERIEELEDKIEQMESERASLAGGPSATPTGGASSAPVPSPTASSSRAAVGPSGPRPGPSTANVDGNVCNDGQDRHLTLVNRGTQTIMYFYASPPSAGDWEEDILGSDVLGEGDSYRINFNTDPRCTCVYDTRAVLADDSEVIRKTNVCTDHTLAYP